EQYFTEASSIIKRILQKSATYLPSQELEKYIALYQDGNDEFISYNHRTTSDTFRVESYNNALFYKGFALETSTHLEQAMQSAPDSIRDIHSRWKGYNRLLAAELALPIAERIHFAYLDSMSNVLEKTLLRASSAFAEAQRQIEWQDVQKALKPGEAAIEFIHYRYSDKKETDSTMYSALLTLPNSKAPLFIPLCEARQLDALIYKANGTRANYLQNLYASTQSDDLLSLNQLIWSPMEKVLEENGIKTVYFAPTGLLHRLNLGALAEGKSGARLADRYKLVPMGSTRLLAEGQTQTEAGHIPLNNALIYGGVRYEMDSSAITKANAQLNATAQDTTGGLFGFSNQTETQRGENWNYLPGTEKEARYLDGLLRRRNIQTTLRLGYEATEESFKQIGQNGPSPSLLHIGTHGFFFPDPQDTSRRRA
ncbi:MAG: CHAT domain-containing protein, partial [Saprospiraceae bacterium]|nr:CHAT domain-containing protein [Saprospiraceae bacterium]